MNTKRETKTFFWLFRRLSEQRTKTLFRRKRYFAKQTLFCEPTFRVTGKQLFLVFLKPQTTIETVRKAFSYLVSWVFTAVCARLYSKRVGWTKKRGTSEKRFCFAFRVFSTTVCAGLNIPLQSVHRVLDKVLMRLCAIDRRDRD